MCEHDWFPENSPLQNLIPHFLNPWSWAAMRAMLPAARLKPGSRFFFENGICKDEPHSRNTDSI